MAGPRRIVCLTEETCEWLYLLGEEKRIVGISAYTVRPPRARQEKPRVSAFISGNIKKIKSLKPDLVVGFSDIQADLAQKLIKEGLNVFITNQRSLAEIFTVLENVAALVGQAQRGKKLIRHWQQKLARIAKQSQGKRRPKVFFQEWNEPIITAIPWVSELITIAGGKNIFAGKAHSLAKDRIVTASAIAAANPDVIIGSWCGKPMDHAWVKNHPQIKEASAVKNNRIYEIDSAEILQPGPALFIDGVDRLYEAIWHA